MRGTVIQPETLPVGTTPIRLEDFVGVGEALENHEEDAAELCSVTTSPPVEPPKLNRGPRFSGGRDPVWTYCFCRLVVADPRFGEMLASHRHILLVGALELADVNGVFWPKKATWACLAHEKPETVKRAVRRAEEVGLLAREPHARPNGYQGSNTYRFEATLVEAAWIEAYGITGDLP
jgi:hypothetical protein